MNFERALQFALEDDENDKGNLPIVYQIEFNTHLGQFHMDRDECTAFLDEEEVILQDGLQYKILRKEEVECPNSHKKYHLVHLAHPI